MSKLLDLMPWLTLESTAARFSHAPGVADHWKASDLLRLAIDHHIQIAVHLATPVFVRRVEVTEEIEDGQAVMQLGAFSKNAERLEGTWDIAAYGGGLQLLENGYRKAEGLPVRGRGIPSPDGIFLHSPDKTECYQVLDMNLSFTIAGDSDPESEGAKGQNTLKITSHKDLDDGAFIGHIEDLIGRVTKSLEPVIEEPTHTYHLSASLPEDFIFVVRSEEVAAFEARHFGSKIKANLAVTERESVHQIITALASMANLDLSAPYKAAETLRLHAARQGLSFPGSNETLKKFFQPPKVK